MKRSESLYKLSHHHHHGLVMAQRLKKAGMEESSLSVEEIIEKLMEFWQDIGSKHFREEEELLLPLYACYGSLERPEIAEMLLEHVRIRAMARHLQNSPLDVAVMHELGLLLETHIRKEERVIFPWVEKVVPERELQKLAEELSDLIPRRGNP